MNIKDGHMENLTSIIETVHENMIDESQDHLNGNQLETKSQKTVKLA